MKRFFKSVLLALAMAAGCAGGANAQAVGELWDGDKADEGVTLGVQAGLNLSKFTHVDRWGGILPGVNVGIMAEKPILNSLAVKAGILYSMKGTKDTNDEGVGKLTTTFSPSYIEIPILASYRYQFTDNIRFTFDFGPYFAFGVNGKDKKELKGGVELVPGWTTADSKTEYDVFEKGQLKRFDFGFQFGPSIVVNNRFSAGLIFDCGAANISDMGGKVGNFTFMINLGYKFITF